MTSTVSANAQQERALALLGSGVSGEAVAATLGVTPAAISQLLSDPHFADQVTQLKYETLQSHNKRDAAYDEIEDSLLKTLKGSIPQLYKPAELLGALKIVNSAKRRGQSAPEQVAAKATVLSITLPTKTVQTFITNNLNQVIVAGEQNLETIQSKTLLQKIKKKETAELAEIVPSTETLNYDLIEAETG